MYAEKGITHNPTTESYAMLTSRHIIIYVFVCIYALNLGESFEAIETRMKDRRLVKMLECRLDRMWSFG